MAAEPTDPPQLTVSIKSWHAVGAWNWDIASDECCGICRMPFDGCCVACKLPGDDCPPVFGKCSHPYHLHCTLRWLQSQPDPNEAQCPMCRRKWEFR